MARWILAHVICLFLVIFNMLCFTIAPAWIAWFHLVLAAASAWPWMLSAHMIVWDITVD